MYIDIHNFYIKWTSFVHEISEWKRSETATVNFTAAEFWGIFTTNKYSHFCTKINDSWNPITNKHENPLRHKGRPAPLHPCNSIGSLFRAPLLVHCFCCFMIFSKPILWSLLSEVRGVSLKYDKTRYSIQLIRKHGLDFYHDCGFPQVCNYLICWGRAHRIPVDNHCKG